MSRALIKSCSEIIQVLDALIYCVIVWVFGRWNCGGHPTGLLNCSVRCSHSACPSAATLLVEWLSG